MKRKMKLYVWENVLVDYDSGIMFAIAKSAKDARAMILEGVKDNTQKRLIEKDLSSKEPDEYDMRESYSWVVWGGS